MQEARSVQGKEQEKNKKRKRKTDRKMTKKRKAFGNPDRSLMRQQVRTQQWVTGLMQQQVTAINDRPDAAIGDSTG